MTRLRGAAFAVALAGASSAATAWSQSVDVERASTLVIGTPKGGARSDRVDAARTGRARTALPSSGLHSEWHTSLGAIVERAPLVDGHGDTYVVGTRGEVIAIARDGTERWRASTSAMQPGPAALLSDDTVVFVDAAGEAIAVRDGALRWRVHFGRSDAGNSAPLPLGDGGIVVATAHDLAALDADGHERARTPLGEATMAPLVSALGKVVAITTSGAVWTWSPGAPEATRVASFGSSVDGGAALADDHTLVAVTGGQLRLAAVDLVRGTTTTRAVAPAGLFLGPPAMRGGTAYLVSLSATSELLVAIDDAGAEVSRALLASRSAQVSADGGALALAAGPHTSPLVDAAGTFAFATVDGAVGIASGAAAELVADACPPVLAHIGGAGTAATAVAGLAPLGPGAFVAICHSGTAVALRGAAGPN